LNGGKKDALAGRVVNVITKRGEPDGTTEREDKGRDGIVGRIMEAGTTTKGRG
jgi:hypothetical protein